MKFCYLVTIEQPDAWVTSADYGDGLTGRQWCEKILGDALALEAAKLLVHAPGFDGGASVQSVELVANLTPIEDGGRVH